jgi:undecaprenyl-diphosphatase
MSHMTYPEAIVVGFIQGVTELFPVSSLGHNVLIPALIGGSWATNLNVAAPQSPYLAFIVGLHVATAIGIGAYFWRDWLRIIGGFFSSLKDRDIRTTDQKMAWLLIVATIPVGLAGLLFEKEFRVLFAEPIRAAIFLVVNGVILFAGEKFRTRRSRQADAELQRQRSIRQTAAALAAPAAPAPARVPSGLAAATPSAALAGAASGTTSGTTNGAVNGAADIPVEAVVADPVPASGQAPVPPRVPEEDLGVQSDERLAAMGYLQGMLIGAAQILALLAGISRDGVTMVAGMGRGLSREDAARFAFLLATPVILAAGVFEAGDLIKYGHGIYGQVLVGSVLAGIGAYVSVRYLVRYFQTRTLTPFAIYCVLFGLGSIIYLQVK